VLFESFGRKLQNAMPSGTNQSTAVWRQRQRIMLKKLSHLVTGHIRSHPFLVVKICCEDSVAPSEKPLLATRYCQESASREDQLGTQKNNNNNQNNNNKKKNPQGEVCLLPRSLRLAGISASLPPEFISSESLFSVLFPTLLPPPPP